MRRLGLRNRALWWALRENDLGRLDLARFIPRALAWFIRRAKRR